MEGREGGDLQTAQELLFPNHLPKSDFGAIDLRVYGSPACVPGTHSSPARSLVIACLTVLGCKLLVMWHPA